VNENIRPSRESIIEKFQACAKQLGKTPGQAIFFKMTGVKSKDVFYYWSRFSALAKEAGLVPNEMNQPLPEEELFTSYARACLYLNKVPTSKEFRIVSRDLHLHSDNVYSNRYGSVLGFKKRFREWLEKGSEEYKHILEMQGWETTSASFSTRELGITTSLVDFSIHPFLPSCLQYLDVLSRGEKPFDSFAENVNTAFEKRCADSFKCLGFEVQELGQGKGRKADSLALARQEGFGAIIDAKVRANGYVLGTEDRKFLEYAVNHSRELLHSGLHHVYFVVVGSEFRNDDLNKLTQYLAQSPVRSVDFITAKALMKIVEQSIRERYKFRLAEIDQLLFGNKIID
jgi:hypothetical protein